MFINVRFYLSKDIFYAFEISLFTKQFVIAILVFTVQIRYNQYKILFNFKI